jgi:ABC-type lipoprotein export system ATPase subunit
LVATGEKLDTEETINNKETGNNTDEKDKEKHKKKHNGIIINEKKLLKNHRNRAFINLENSFSENSPFKESEDLE